MPGAARVFGTSKGLGLNLQQQAENDFFMGNAEMSHDVYRQRNAYFLETSDSEFGSYANCFVEDQLDYGSNPGDINRLMNSYFLESSPKPFSTKLYKNGSFLDHSILEGKAVLENGMKMPVVSFPSMETTECASKPGDVWFSNCFMEDNAEFKNKQERNLSFSNNELGFSTPQFKVPIYPVESSWMSEFRDKLENNNIPNGKFIQASNSALQFDNKPGNGQIPTSKFAQGNNQQSQFDFKPNNFKSPTSKCYPETLDQRENAKIPGAKIIRNCNSGKLIQTPSEPIAKAKIPTGKHVRCSNGAVKSNFPYEFVNESGQRKYGGPPPGWEGPAPIKGSEIFIGRLPRDIFEDELMPLFESIGTIYEFRLMIDFSYPAKMDCGFVSYTPEGKPVFEKYVKGGTCGGTSRGYAFATYTSPADAKRAIEALDGYEIRPKRKIGVCKSVDNCKLYIGLLPTKKTKAQVSNLT